MFKRLRGSTLVEYAIPTALVGLVVGMSVYGMVSSGALANFISSSTNMKISQSDGLGIIEDLNTPNITSVNTNPDNTTTTNTVSKSCTNGVCEIKLGDVSLSGIPEDFGAYVETTGTSGGTDKISELLTQIASQLESEGNPADAAKIKELAINGHNIASLQKTFEEKVSACNGDVTCVSNQLYTMIPQDANFDESLYDFHNADFQSFGWMIEVGRSRQAKLDGASWYNDWKTMNSPATHFVESYDSIMASDTVSDNTKKVVTELYSHLGRLSENFEVMSHYYLNNGDVGADYIDPITGELIQGNEDIPVDNMYSFFTGHKPSSVSHLDSSLICATGGSNDTGVQCK